MAEIGKGGLMFVDDPEIALKTLFEHSETTITNESYVRLYKEIKYGKETDKKIGETKAETHLGTLRIYELVEQISNAPPNNNRITPKGIILKKIWEKEKDWGKNKKFQKALADLLLSNPHKSNLIREFLNFIMRAKTKNEILKKYKWGTGNTLIEWCRLAGMSEKKDDKYVIIKRPIIKKEFSIEELWTEVKNCYEEIRRLGYDKRKMFIDFSDLRFRAAYNLGLNDPREFDDLFRKLLKSEFGQFINLHGTLVGGYNEEKNLEYRSRLYPFISLTPEN